MKSILAIIFILIPVLCFGQGMQPVGGVTFIAASGAKCTAGSGDATGSWPIAITNDAGNTTLANDGTVWASQQYTITSGATITQWKLQAANPSCTSGNMVCSLYTAGASNKPGTEISGSSVAVACTSISTDTDAPFVLSSPTVVSATSLHVVCRMSGANASIYLRTSTSSAYAGGIANLSTDSGSSWTNAADEDKHISLYGCEP